ncbi:MAG: biotin--[acetyl-CoA-carboxylase] ligase [Actinomycetes bacterium]
MSDFLDARALSLGVSGGLWRRVDVVASTGSTNADLADAAREGTPAGRVLVSGHQSSGRGRLARRWEAPPDTSVACSVLVEPRRPVAEWGWLPLLVGMAVTDGVREAAGLDAGLKWPNDVLVADRKVCGILCEAVSDAGPPLAVLGFGLNVALTAEQLPVPTATSTRLAGSDASATAITVGVLSALERWLTAWDDGLDLRHDYRRRCVTLGRAVSVQLPGGERVSGSAVDVDAHGGLVVSVDGVRTTFVAGDVLHLRTPAEWGQAVPRNA